MASDQHTVFANAAFLERNISQDVVRLANMSTRGMQASLSTMSPVLAKMQQQRADRQLLQSAPSM